MLEVPADCPSSHDDKKLKLIVNGYAPSFDGPKNSVMVVCLLINAAE
jgi:hypothetical protein